MSDIVKDDVTNCAKNIIRWKMARKIFLMILEWKIYISSVKNAEKKYFFEFRPFFGPKIGQFCMKNGKISVEFEKCLLNLDDFERHKRAKIVFLFFLCKGIYIWSRTLPSKIKFWAIWTLCELHIIKNEHFARELFFGKYNFFGYLIFEN